MNSNSQSQSSLIIDLYKFIAAQVIVFHHICSYGPISNSLHELSPTIAGFLFDYGRYAVQVFLVIGGYLACQSIPKALNRNSYLQLVVRRYLRLVPTYFIALVITIVCATIARIWLQDEFVGRQETITQLLAHIFLLQSVLGVDSISAGAWYVAIDMQLYAFLALLLMFFNNRRVVSLVLITFIFSSLFYFSQNDYFENYFIYFVGAYGLGAIANFASEGVDNKSIYRLFLIVGIVILITTFFHFFLRSTIAWALAFSLILRGRYFYLPRLNLVTRLIAWGSRCSYGLFLIHFSVILIGNTIFEAYGFVSPYTALIMGMLVWGVSLILAGFLFTQVESKIGLQTFKKYLVTR